MQQRHARKICMLGDIGVGKTSLVRRYVFGSFNEQYQATLGANVYRFSDEADGTDVAADQPVDLIIWDTVGERSPPPDAPRTMRGSAGAIIVADVTRPDTTQAALAYAACVIQHLPGRPFVFALNKCDLVADEPPVESEVAALAQERRTSVLRSSALTGDGVVGLFRALTGQIRIRGL